MFYVKLANFLFDWKQLFETKTNDSTNECQTRKNNQILMYLKT